MWFNSTGPDSVPTTERPLTRLYFPLVPVWLLTGEATLLPSTVLLITSERQLNRSCSSASCICLAVGTAEMGKIGGKFVAHPLSVSDAGGTLTITGRSAP